jgi:hypothetical protein
MKSIARACAALILIAVAGCGWSLGSSSHEQVQKPTVGQQLIDLKKARDLGAITDTEYAKKRKELIDTACATTP